MIFTIPQKKIVTSVIGKYPSDLSDLSDLSQD